MAVFIESADPSALLKAFKDAMSAGKVRTWVEDADGDFTHTSDQWRKRAWLRPTVEAGQIVMTLIWPEGAENQHQDVLAFYFGHMIETMLRDFPKRVEAGRATPIAVR